MSQEKTGTKVWTKPQVKRIGVIQDVSGNGGPQAQQQSAGTS